MANPPQIPTMSGRVNNSFTNDLDTSKILSGSANTSWTNMNTSLPLASGSRHNSMNSLNNTNGVVLAPTGVVLSPTGMVLSPTGVVNSSKPPSLGSKPGSRAHSLNNSVVHRSTNASPVMPMGTGSGNNSFSHPVNTSANPTKFAVEDHPVNISMAQSYASSRPPHYDSLFGRFAYEKDVADGNVDYTQRVVAMACCGTICTIITLLLCFTIPIVSLVIGIVYIDNCPLDTKIPGFLIGIGICGIMKGVIQLGVCCMNMLREEGDEDDIEKRPVSVCCNMSLNIAMFLLFICECAFVYGQYDEWQYTNRFGDDYCDEVCFRYAFWFLNIGFIFIGLGVLCLGIIFFAAVTQRKDT